MIRTTCAVSVATPHESGAIQGSASAAANGTSSGAPTPINSPWKRNRRLVSTTFEPTYRRHVASGSLAGEGTAAAAVGVRDGHTEARAWWVRLGATVRLSAVEGEARSDVEGADGHGELCQSKFPRG